MGTDRVVATAYEAIENIHRYQADLKRLDGLRARLSRHSGWYATRGPGNGWLFAPSKFIGYAGNSGKRYLSSYLRDDGGVTERALDAWFVPVNLDTALGREIKAAFGTFLARFEKAPKKNFRISVVESDLGSEVSNRISSNHPANDYLSRISSDPAICGGRPCIKGTRMRVSDILDMLAAGAERKEILADFPYITDEDVAAALHYASRAAAHRLVRAA